MKAFLFSIFALLLLCLIVIFNGVLVLNTSEKMSIEISKIKNSSSVEALEKLENIWDKDKLLVSISVPHSKTDELERNLILLRQRVECDDRDGTSEAVALVLRSLEELKAHSIANLSSVL